MELGQPLTVDNFKYQFAELLAFKLREMNLEMDEVQGRVIKNRKEIARKELTEKVNYHIKTSTF